MSSDSPAAAPAMPIVTELPARRAAVRRGEIGTRTQQRNMSLWGPTAFASIDLRPATSAHKVNPHQGETP